MKSFRSRVGLFFLALYFALFTLVFASFDEHAILTGVSFLTINLGISVVLYLSYRFSNAWPIHVLIYSVYFIAYIFKGIVQYATGLNSHYSEFTIRVLVDFTDYANSLYYVSVGHACLLFVFIIIGVVSKREYKPQQTASYLSNKSINALLTGALVWIIATSIVMYSFGVAVMGTDNVSLPFRLSGILFYSRTIVIPLALIYFLEKALVFNNEKLFRYCITVFLILAVSEIIVRASKSPMFFLLLQLAFLYLALFARGITVSIRIKARYLAMMFIFALALWPVVEVYRTMMVQGQVSVELAGNVADYVDNSDRHFALFVLERLLQRLVGFLQLSGLVTDIWFDHDLKTVFQYSNIAAYYTQHYLGYTMEGHLSSPSLLGAAIILGGENYWHLIFSGYLLAISAIWRFTFFLHRLAIPLATFIGTEAFNTVIAGTIDSSLTRIGYVFSVALILELIIRWAAPKPDTLTRKTSPFPVVEINTR